MSTTYIISNVPADRVDIVRRLAEAEGGEMRAPEEEADGEFTLTFVYPDPVKVVAQAAKDKSSTQTEPPWMPVARGEQPTKELDGAADNPRILAYHASTNGGAAPDEIPWCASFVNWCVEQAKTKGTDSKRARSWAAWGRDVSGAPPLGCIVVLSRGTDPALGHVGFLAGISPGRVTLLGGNQSNMVCEQSYPMSRVVAMRMPA